MAVNIVEKTLGILLQEQRELIAAQLDAHSRTFSHDTSCRSTYVILANTGEDDSCNCAYSEFINIVRTGNAQGQK